MVGVQAPEFKGRIEVTASIEVKNLNITQSKLLYWSFVLVLIKNAININRKINVLEN